MKQVCHVYLDYIQVQNIGVRAWLCVFDCHIETDGRDLKLDVFYTCTHVQELMYFKDYKKSSAPTHK